MSPSLPGTSPRSTIVDRAFSLLMSLAMLMATVLTVAPARVGAAEPSNCGVVPVDLVFVIDRSGSMNTSEGAHTRLGWAKLAATGLVDLFDANGGVGAAGIHQVGVSTFGGTSVTRNVQLGTSAAATVNAAINAIASNGGTPFDIGMAEGADNMTDGDRAAPVTQIVIFLSDGNPDPDSYAPSGAEVTSYLASADKAYAVAIGPDGGNLGGGGTGVSYALMRQISKPGYVSDGNPGGFRAVTNASGLPNLFAELYEEIACPMGKLEVRKALNPSNDAGRFDLWIGDAKLADEAGHNGTTGEQTLDAGTYTVAETADGETTLANYSASISCVNTAMQNAPVAATLGQGTSWSVNVTDASDIVCTITNTRKSGTLTVTKVVKNDDGGTATCSDFEFKVNGGSTIGFEADCTNVLALPTGSYSVTEPAFAGYDTTYAGCTDLSVTADGNVTCTITNDDRPGTLIVNKDLTTDDGSDATCADFSFRVNGGSPIAFEADCSNSMTVDAGTYSVVETDADGFETGYANCSGLQIASGGSATCTISNDDQPGTLIVVKELKGGDDECADFSFRINGDDAIAFEGDCDNEFTVPAGSYTVVETDADGYETSYENCTRVWVANGAEATCTIKNERETGSLTVVKDLNPADDPGRFDLQIDGATFADGVGDGGSTGAIAVLTGMHTVGEVADGFTSLANYATKIACWSDGGEGAEIASGAGAGPLSVEVEADEDVLCVISNDRVQVSIGKASDVGDNAAVEPGESIHFTLSVTVSDGAASGVVVSDELPSGLTYVAASAVPSAGFAFNGQELTWTVGSLAAGTHTFEYDATVDEDASGTLTNLGCVDADQNDELVCDETTLRVPQLAIEKVADTDLITISGPADALVATPSVVTWTLSYTLTDGPVTNVVITDEIPEGFVFLDAADGGNFADGTVTWSFAGLAESGSVSFRTTVDPETISRTDPTVNVATIDSDETGEDEGTDSVTVAVNPPPKGGNPTPTPRPQLPNTALGIGLGGQSVSVPLELLAVVFIGSLGALALVTVRTRGRRR